LIAIRCEALGKRYRIGRQERYRSLRDSLADFACTPFRKIAAAWHGVGFDNAPVLWALKDLSLEIQLGEIVGIIGRNGSGKSTLLKILSRITRPTEGSAQLSGRVGTLLEVGTGFHPELTGRENIYLYGAILGMRRSEINRKFDEIVEFSECNKLLDTPMKHYSSGMYVRMAFSVAAHIETEILLVDEVLAVGDAGFQKKCLGKMSDVGRQGRTVLFVSHNMLAVESLCTRAICLHEGRAVLEGAPKFVTTSYLREWLPAFKEQVYDNILTAPGDDNVRLHRAKVYSLGLDGAEMLTVRTPLSVEFEYWKLSARTCISFVAEVFNEHGLNVFNTPLFSKDQYPSGRLRSQFTVPGDLLNDGIYRVSLIVLVQDEEIDHWQDIVTFEVRDTPSELRGHYYDEWPGAIRPNLIWRTEWVDALPSNYPAD
jgi:lipopolysaccharide transport system ATP-binding protein